MKTSLEDRAFAVFESALDVPPEERDALLDRACAGDALLRAEVENLLEQDALAERDGFLAPLDGDAQLGKLAACFQPAHAAGTTLAGRYRLLEPLGEGGMGTVWKAEQREPVKRQVAVKLIRAGLDSKTLLVRFEAERQALALMEHPHIARVFDGGTTESGHPFLVMELVQGQPLTAYCDQHRLTIAQRLDLFTQVCAAVQHAHQKAILHRDLKPSNILVTEHDGKLVPKVIDFGLAKALQSGSPLTEESLHTGYGMVLGTPLYMAPEQVAKPLEVDTRADTYALGVILYELLTGTTPVEKHRYKEADWHDFQRLLREVDPPRPSARLSSSDSLPALATIRQTEPKKLTRQVRGELDWIVMKALEKDRDRRYETANGLALDVQRHLTGMPVLAHPPSAGYRMRKFIRRNKGPTVAVGLLLLTLLGGIASTTWGMMRAETRRVESDKRLAQLEKGNEFITGILSDLDIDDVKAGPDPLEAVLGKRLVKASEQIEGEAVGDPLVVADLQNRIGTALLSLGHPHEAITLFEKVRDTRTAALGSDHPDTLASMSNLAVSLQRAGKLASALPLYQEVHTRRKAVLGEDHLDTISSLGHLASGHRNLGRPDLAFSMFEKCIEVRKSKLGVDHADTLNSMTSLAEAYLAVGLIGPATRDYEEVLRLQKLTLGAADLKTLVTVNNLALAYQAAGKLELALPMLEENYKRRRAKLGIDHPGTLQSMNNLSSAYMEANKLDSALALREEVLAHARFRMGPSHPVTHLYTLNLAKCLQALDRRDEALSHHLEAAIGIELHGFQSQYADWIVNGLIDCYEGLGHFDRAEVWRRKWMAGVKTRYGGESLADTIELARLGSNLLRQGKWIEAEAELRECLALRQKYRPDEWTTFNTHSMLAAALLGQQKYADAEPLLLQGYEGMKQRTAQIPPQGKIRLAEALERLIQLYTAWDKPDEARKWFAELEALKKP